MMSPVILLAALAVIIAGPWTTHASPSAVLLPSAASPPHRSLATPLLTNVSRLCQKAWSNSGKGLGRLNCSGFEAVDLDLDGPSDSKKFATASQEWAYWKGQGKLLIGYISVGSIELSRADANQFPKDSYFTQPMEGWPDERWIRLDKWQELKTVMTSRLQRVRALCGAGYAACGYEGDNVGVIGGERYGQYEPGSAQYNAALALNVQYATWLATTAHSLGLLAVFKNGAGSLATSMAPLYDAVITEQGVQYGELEEYGAFLKLNKPVWDFEYRDGPYKTAASVKAAISRQRYNSAASSIQWDSGKDTASVHSYLTVGGLAAAPLGA